MVALNRLSGHSSGFFLGAYHAAESGGLAAGATEAQRKARAAAADTRCGGVDLKKSKSLLRDGVPSISARDVKIAVCPSQKMSYLKANSVDLVVTSPPFLNTVDYKKDNWLRLWFAGLKEETMACDVHASLERWRSLCATALWSLRALCVRGGVWRSRWGGA